MLDSFHHWPVRALGELVSFRNGLNFTQAANGERVKIVGVGDFLDREEIKDIAALTEGCVAGEVREEETLNDGDLLFVRSNGNKALVGRCALVRPGSSKVCFSGFTIRARVTVRDVDAFYLVKLARSEVMLRELHRLGSGSSINNLSQDILSEVRLPFPPLPEQRRIAGILRTWDEAIDAASRLIDAKRRRLDVLRANLLTPAHRGEGWRMAPLGNLTAEGKGRNKGGALGREQVMGVSNARGVVPMRDATIASDLTRYKLLPPQGFAYNPMRINVGSIAMSALDAPVLVSPDYVVFTCRPKALAPGYLDHFRRTRFWSHYVNAMGSDSVRVRIYYRDLADIEIPVPGLAEQKRILRVLDLAAQDLAASETHLDALKRQKRGLMQKLLTGDWRVPAEPAG